MTKLEELNTKHKRNVELMKYHHEQATCLDNENRIIRDAVKEIINKEFVSLYPDSPVSIAVF